MAIITTMIAIVKRKTNQNSHKAMRVNRTIRRSLIRIEITRKKEAIKTK